MADYPAALVQSHPAREPWRDKLLVSYSRGANFKGRRLASAKKRDFEFAHTLTSDERATLEAFYDANRLLTFNFWWTESPGTIYVVAFSDENGLDFKRVEGGYWGVTITLAQV
jgi:hypothetical protein